MSQSCHGGQCSTPVCGVLPNSNNNITIPLVDQSGNAYGIAVISLLSTSEINLTVGLLDNFTFVSSSLFFKNCVAQTSSTTEHTTFTNPSLDTYVITLGPALSYYSCNVKTILKYIAYIFDPSTGNEVKIFFPSCELILCLQPPKLTLTNAITTANCDNLTFLLTFQNTGKQNIYNVSIVDTAITAAFGGNILYNTASLLPNGNFSVTTVSDGTRFNITVPVLEPNVPYTFTANFVPVAGSFTNATAFFNDATVTYDSVFSLTANADTTISCEDASNAKK